jgi:hypothetical protein
VALDWLRRGGHEFATGEAIEEQAFDEPLRAVDEALVKSVRKIPNGQGRSGRPGASCV